MGSNEICLVLCFQPTFILGSKSIGDKFEFKEVNEKTETISLEEIKNKLLNRRNLN